MRRTSVAFLMVYLSAALVLGFAASSANAQDNSSVTGVVTDQTGAVVPDATVTLQNSSIGFSSTKTTNALGAYEFSNVPPASNYSLVFSKSGFSGLTIDKIALNVGTKETRDAQLHVGDTKVSVEVVASSAETLNTTDATIGSNVDGDRVQDLPNVFYNSAANYLALAPGVVPNDGGGNGGEVAGTRSDQTNITLDGLDVNDQRGGFSFTTTINTPLDSIQEFRITSTGDDATYGHSGGGQMELVTKGGTNNFHGELFEYNRTTVYTANDYFNNLQGIPNPQLIRNQFGGNVGGPILKNKLFFFFSYNGLRQVAPQQNYLTVPVSSFYNGQLMYDGTNGRNGNLKLPARQLLQPSDPCTAAASCPTQGPGADQSLLNFMQTRGYPLPNNSSVGDGLNTSGYYFVSPARDHDNTYILRLDFQATTNHRLFFRATRDRSLDGGFGGAKCSFFRTIRTPSPAM